MTRYLNPILKRKQMQCVAISGVKQKPTPANMLSMNINSNLFYLATYKIANFFFFYIASKSNRVYNH